MTPLSQIMHDTSSQWVNLSIQSTRDDVLCVRRVSKTGHAAKVTLLFEYMCLALPLPHTQLTHLTARQCYPLGRLVYCHRRYFVHCWRIWYAATYKQFATVHSSDGQFVRKENNSIWFHSANDSIWYEQLAVFGCGEMHIFTYKYEFATQTVGELFTSQHSQEFTCKLHGICNKLVESHTVSVTGNNCNTT